MCGRSTASPSTSTLPQLNSPFRLLLLFAALFADHQLTFTGGEVPDREKLQALGLVSSTASIQVRGHHRHTQAAADLQGFRLVVETALFFTKAVVKARGTPATCQLTPPSAHACARLPHSDAPMLLCVLCVFALPACASTRLPACLSGLWVAAVPKRLV